MDRNQTGLSDYQNDSKFDETIMFPNSYQYPVIEHGLEFNTPSPDLTPEDSDSTDPLLKYISQMLMEKNMKDQPHMFHDHCVGVFFRLTWVNPSDL